MKKATIFTLCITELLAFASCKKESSPKQPDYKNLINTVARKRKPGEPTGKSDQKRCTAGTGNCAYALAEYPADATAATPRVYVELLDDTHLLVDNDYNYHNEDGDVTTLTSETLYLPQSFATEFDKTSIRLLPGTYHTTYDTNPYGSMVIDVECK
jgi:hypothetical protein